MNIKAAGAEYALKYAVQRDHGDRAQLIVEVTSESSAETDRQVKRPFGLDLDTSGL
ncbi:hypothetical protein [Streptomyces rimosus]|uniref:hypothetical protein n=1 Tax=Streptomyces rimosus TaxID=1927 RepID=UPI000B09E9FF|nr:hypothetical protein [Streptomyces rimosus]